ncbi:uncharacterized protein LOC126795559 [Argentina anserina]|uniref:uncharacterized protein LOC126795559 n=1 Tax=Argentina anserina TaxID=57926 RepID=UPI0021763D0E|nr:uncharacterized protein LOC126795559 [Potentilla anserina]
MTDNREPKRLKNLLAYYPSHHPAFTTYGFNSWKNVNSKKSGLLKYVGALNSPHNACMRQWEVLRNPSKHIESVISTQSTHEKLDNRLRLVAAIESARLLAHQGCTFRGHDESSNSSNGGNFTVLQNAFGRMNLEVKRVLDNAPGNAKVIREEEIADLVAAGKLETGIRPNQTTTLQRAGATRWGSHFRSISSLIKKFGATQKTLAYLVINGLPKIQGEAKSVGKAMKKFDFVFCLFLMHDTRKITDFLCQSLQKKAMDILNALRVLSIAKQKLQAMRDNGWDNLILRITSFCCEHNIIVPDLSTPYKKGTERACPEDIIKEHYYRINILNALIDAFKPEDVCSLALRFYPMNFSAGDMLALEMECGFFLSDVQSDLRFANTTSMSDLCRRMEDDFLDDLMVLYIEKKFIDSVHNNDVIEEFTKLGPRRVSFWF